MLFATDRRDELKLALDTTSGAPLIPEDLEPIIVELLRRLSPFCYMLPIVQANGKTHEFNRRTAFNQGNFEGENAQTPTGQSTYARVGKQLKILRAKGGVSGFQQASSKKYINSLQAEIEGAAKALGWAMEFGCMWGNATADSYMFDGLDVELQSNRFDGGHAVVALSDIDALIDSVWERGVHGMGQMGLFMSPQMSSKLAQLQTKIQIPITKVQVEGGYEFEAYRGIPIMRSTFTRPTLVTGAPVIADSGTAGSLVAATAYNWRLAAVTLTGEQVASASTAHTTGAGITSVDITLPALATGIPYLWKLYRTVGGGAAGTEVLVGTYVGRTYDGDGTPTGLVTTINDGLADASLGTDTPQNQTGSINDESIWLAYFDGEQSLAMASLLNEVGEKVDNLIQLLPLARIRDREEFLIQSYQTLAVKGEVFNAVLRNVRPG